MRINNYNKKTFYKRKGFLWLIGTTLHYTVASVTTVLSLLAAFVIFMGLFEMEFSSWNVWWKSADTSFTGMLMAFAVGMAWSFYNKIRKSYLNAYLDSGSFGVTILTLKFPFLVIGALISVFFKFLESDVLEQCTKESKEDKEWREHMETWYYADYLKEQERNSR